MLKLSSYALLNQNIELFLSCDRKNANFVADYDSLTLLNACSVWGHTWTLIYDITAHFPGNFGFKEQKLKKTLQNTYENFKDTIKFMNQTHEAIRDCLGKNDGSLSEYRSLVITSVESLPSLFFPFRSFVCELSAIKRVNAVFQKIFGKTLISQEDTKVLEDFKNEYRIFALEGFIQQGFPYNILVKMCKKEELMPEDEELFDRWLLAIKERENSLPVDVLHQALFAFVHMYSDGDEKSLEEELVLTSKIEWELFKKGCLLFDVPDPHHISWVKSLIPPMACDVHQKAIIGKRCSYRTFLKLGIYCFENKANSDEILVFGKNAAHLGIWKVYADEISWAIPCVKIIEMDVFGRFVRIEKIKEPLSEVIWKTQHASVKAEDIPILDEISRLIAWLSCQRITPCDLKLEEVFFTQNNRLKVFAPLSQKRVTVFDFNALEALVLQIAKGNKHVPNVHLFRYIMHTSKLIEHPIGKFYRSMIEAVLVHEKKIDISLEANLQSISDPKVIYRIEEMLEELNNVKSLLFDRLIDRFKAYDEEQKEILSRKIAKAIFAMHNELGCCSTIAHDLTKRLEEFFSQYDSLSEKEEDINASKTLLQRFVPFLN